LIEERLDAARLRELVRTVDLVVDGNDNFAKRYAVNHACFQAGGQPLSRSLTEERLDAARLRELVRTVDLVIDGTDNFATRYAVNDACFEAGVPLVSGAAIRGDGESTR